MKKERILNNSLNVIRKFLKENVPVMGPPTNSVGADKISGLTKDPPVKLKELKKRQEIQPFKELFRRGDSVQPKYPS